MRPKTLLVLLLLVLALGAFIWFFERDLPGTDERAERVKRVLAFEADQITELVIEQDRGTVRLSRPAAGEGDADVDAHGEQAEARVRREWRLLEPFDVRADGSAADQLVDALTRLEKERQLDDADPAAVGLAEPRAVVTVRTPDAESTLRIGAEIPASSNMVLASGADVFVVAKGVWSTLSKEPGDWRGRELFPLHRGAVERVELVSPAASWTLMRHEGDAFWLEAPVEDVADSGRVDELLDAMFSIEAREFLDQPEMSAEAMGLEPATSRLSVDLVGREQPVVLEVGGEIPEAGDAKRYARIEGQLVTIGDELDEALVRAPADWQATSWTALEVFEIDSFRVQDAAGELLLERAGADWRRDGEEISYGPVSDFLYALTGAAGERVVPRGDAADLGADLARATLELELRGDDDLGESLVLYDASAGSVAGSDGRDYLLTLSEGTVEDLQVKLQAIRDEPVLTADNGEEQEG